MIKRLLLALALLGALAVPASTNVLIPTRAAGGGGGGGITLVRSVTNSCSVPTHTCTATLSTTNAGDGFVVLMSLETGTSDTVNFTATVSASNGTACTLVAGTQAGNNTSSSIRMITDMFWCPNNASGVAVTFTATDNSGPAGPAQYGYGMEVLEFSGLGTTSGDAVLGSVNFQDATTTATVTASGALPQNNDLVVSYMIYDGGGALTGHGANQTMTALGSYQTVDTAGTTPTHTYTFTSSAHVATAIGVFKPSGVTTISGVTPSTTSFTTPATAGSTIATLTANCSSGSCAGATFGPLATTGACSGAASANNGSFAVSGSNLNIGASTVNAGSYQIGMTVTLSGATNSSACFAVPTLVGSNAGTTPTAWDPLAKAANVTLTNTVRTNDTAAVASGGFGSVRGDNSRPHKSTDANPKYHFEIVITGNGTGGGFVIGLSDGGGLLTSFCGHDATGHDIGLSPENPPSGGGTGVMYYQGGQAFYWNGPTPQNGDRLAIEVDLNAKKLWWQNFNRSPGVWSDITGGASVASTFTGVPNTGFSGVPFAGMTTNGAGVLLCFTGAGSGGTDSNVLKTQASAFLATVSSGFTAWDPP